MHNARLRVMAGLAGATLCLFAVTSYAQNTDPAAGTSAQTGAQTTAQPPAPTGDNTAQPPADAGTTNGTITTTGSQTTTETTTTSFPGGIWGIAAVAVVVLLVLFGLFRGRDTTVVKDTYVTADSPPVTRSSGMGTADDRVVTSRAASATETTTTRSSDPNARS
jgi:hypothetical protein